MSYAHAVLHLLATVGYPGLAVVLFIAALGIGAPIPVTALLLVVGALSGTPGGPSTFPIAALAVFAIVCGHSVDYACGRLGNRLLVGRLSRALDRLGGSRHLLGSSKSTRARALPLFLSRFLLTPLASLVSVLAGMIGVPAGLFLGLEALGTAIYVGGSLVVGHLFGPRAFEGNGLLLFWLIVAALTLLPVGILRLAPRSDPAAQPPTTRSPVAVVGRGPRIRRARAALGLRPSFGRRING